MFCHSCGTEVSGGAQFCPACGQSLVGTASPPVVYVPQTGIRAQSGRWIGEGWRIVSQDLGMFILITLTFVALNSALPVILQGPLCIGMHLYCIKRMMGRRAEFADLFAGFNFFIPALVASLLIWLFTTAAALLCLIPGLIVAAMYKFTYLFMLDKKMDFWPAMQASHAVVKSDYFGFTMFLLLMILIDVLGALCFVVGLLVSIPITFAAVTVAYRDLVGFEPDTLNRS
jgi:zinc-ribbon domain